MNTAINIANKIAVDFKRHEVFVGGRQIPLTYREYKILTTLITSSVCVGIQDFRDRLSTPYEDTTVNRKTISVMISKLRKKLSISVIKTIPKVGYKFTVEG